MNLVWEELHKPQEIGIFTSLSLFFRYIFNLLYEERRNDGV